MPDRAVNCSRYSCRKYLTFDAALKNFDDVEITAKKIGVRKYKGAAKVKAILVQRITRA